jgi:hypothetical protein
MNGTDLIARVLADMRTGCRVLVVAPTADAARAMHEQAAARLATGELARRSATVRITRNDGGWIEFRSYVSVRGGATRGMSLDRVYVDHTELCAILAPCLVTSRDGAGIVHYGL